MATRQTAKARVENLDTTDVDALAPNGASETPEAREEGTPRNDALAALAQTATAAEAPAIEAEVTRPVGTGRTVTASDGKAYLVLARWYTVRHDDIVHTVYRGDRLVASVEDAERGLANGELVEV